MPTKREEAPTKKEEIDLQDEEHVPLLDSEDCDNEILEDEASSPKNEAFMV